MEARRRLPAFEARIAQDALLGFAGRPVEVGFLVRAARDAHAPSAASLLADQHDAIFTALIDRPLWAGRYATRIETMVADARQVEEHGAVDLLQLTHFLFGSAVEVRIVVGVNLRTAQVVVPVRPCLDGVHVLASNHRDGARGWLIVAQRRVEQVLVVVGPGFEVVVKLGQIGVVEDVGERSPLALQAQPQPLLSLAFDHPAAAVLGLVLPTCRVSGTRLGLHVVPVHVLGALAVGPNVLARDGASVTTDALVQMEDHCDLRSEFHVSPPSSYPLVPMPLPHPPVAGPSRTATTVTSNSSVIPASG